jgi:hypothetical protein
MECPVCGLINPRDNARCDCGFDFATRRGGSRPPFHARNRGVIRLVAAAAIVVGIVTLGSRFDILPAVVSLLLLPSPIALGIAWVT